MMRVALGMVLALLPLPAVSDAQNARKPREHELKLPIGGTPGSLNAITDVTGVEVGQTTLISGSGALVVGKGPVRTGVTVVHPRGKANPDPVFAAWFTLNGNGEMTGTTWVQESGLLEGPVAITNTHSVGVVRDAIIQWEVRQKNALQPWWLPVVAETYDGSLNDISGFHVKPEHVLAAMDNAAGGLPQEGAVGGGTGMVCHGFKGGIGTASRKLSGEQGGYTVGVLVQCNYGVRRDLRIAGVPVGEEIPDLTACIANDRPLPPNSSRRRCDAPSGRQDEERELGSIIVVVATDAPLLPHQLERISRRAGMGLARMGSNAGNGSGDLFVAFSTANQAALAGGAIPQATFLANDKMDPVFVATVQATEEAITNALIAARDMQGTEGHYAKAIDHETLATVLKRYGRLVERR
jgi:D-aminopeptidase